MLAWHLISHEHLIRSSRDAHKTKVLTLTVPLVRLYPLLPGVPSYPIPGPFFLFSLPDLLSSLSEARLGPRRHACKPAADTTR